MKAAIFVREVMMKKIIFICILSAIIITPCTAQQINNSIDPARSRGINESIHFENMIFSWQYHYLENDINISFINLNPIFFSNFHRVDTWEYVRRNTGQLIYQIGNISSDENGISDFIAFVGSFYLIFAAPSHINQYQHDIYKNYKKEQSVNEKILK